MRGKRLQVARLLYRERKLEIGLEEFARLAETTTEAVRAYVDQGLLGEEIQRSGTYAFGEGELYLVRRMEQLRMDYGVSLQAAGIILDLAARVEELEREIRGLRDATGR